MNRDRAVGALLGLAVGDALGTAREFALRDSKPPLTDMIGGGAFRLKPGEWTDDTSMALCLAESLLACSRLDHRDLIDRFVRWWRFGENSVTGQCFDIGGATEAALRRYKRTGDPVAGSAVAESAGNGSLMRLAPVAIFHADDAEAASRAAIAQSETTHRAPAALDACALFAALLVEAIGGAAREQVLAPRAWRGEGAIALIARADWRHKERREISSSGYVVHTLEAALWCVGRSANYQDAVLLAANLGHDADTVAAVTGQLAGALWGAQAIPADWRRKLAWAAKIERLAGELFDRAASRAG